MNKNGQVQKTIATLEQDDPNREHWWAHTGGGAGNFGVVTRYWFRSPGVDNKDSSHLLPRAPELVETAEIDWAWNDINEESFVQLVDNFCNWSKQNAAYGIPANSLFATLHLWNKATGKIQLKAVLIDQQQAGEVLANLLKALNTSLNIPYHLERKKMSWLAFALRPFPDIFSDIKESFKLKDAFLVEPFTTKQLRVIYQHLTSNSDVPGGFLGLATYGGKVNTVASNATASFQRNAIVTTACVSGWINAEEELKYLEWVRNCYKDIFCETGGVPIHNEQLAGCIIAHPDNDLIDAQLNTSGVPWHELYYRDNYPRLQKVKAIWDPLNVFQHSLSVKAS